MAVLCAEDDFIVQLELLEACALANKTGIDADNAGDAMTKLAAEPIRLVVTSNYQLLQHCREKYPNLPVILLSDGIEGRLAAIGAGFDEAMIVNKPFYTHELADKMSTILAASSAPKRGANAAGIQVHGAKAPTP